MSPDRTCNSSSWTKEEDKAFENALALYSGDSDEFLNIAAAVPGKSLQEIIEHYHVLVEDINDIESGIVPLPKYRRMQSSTVERRKGIPWTPEEHMLFLQGLAKLGRGDWRGICRNFVLSRTPTQVAAHSQKFFLRLKDNDDGKRRKSIYDITSAADITEAFDTGMLSLPGPVTNCTTDAIEGASAVNPEKFPLGAAVGSELNSSFPGVVEFLRGIEGTTPLLSLQPSVAGDTRMYTHPVTVATEGTSGAKRERAGVDTRTSPSLSLHQSVAGGTGMYTHVTVPAEGTSGARHGVDTKTSPLLSLHPSVAGGTGMYTHVTVSAEGTSGASLGVDTRKSPSLRLQQSVVGGTGMYTYPVNNVRYDMEELMTKQLVGETQVGTTVNTASLPLPIADHTGVHGCTASSSGANIGFASTMGASEGGFSVNSIQLPSIPGSSCGGTYPCWDPSNQDHYIFDLEDLFPDHIFGFGK